MTGRDWLWTAGLFIVSMVVYFGLGFSSQWLGSLPFFAPHPLVPPDFGPGAAAAMIRPYIYGHAAGRKMVGGCNFYWRMASEYSRGGILVPRLYITEARARHGRKGMDCQRFDVRIYSHLAALESAAHRSIRTFGDIHSSAQAQHLNPDSDARVDEPDPGCGGGPQRGGTDV